MRKKERAIGLIVDKNDTELYAEQLNTMKRFFGFSIRENIRSNPYLLIFGEIEFNLLDFRSHTSMALEKYSKYYEIFLDIGIEELRIRDTKGLYKKAFDKKIKNVVGVDIDFPRPINPDLIIDIKDQKEGVEYCVKKIFNHLQLNTKI